jgi:hypothetical protein
MSQNNYRFYAFVHFMLSDIQKGIQTGHCSNDLLVKYETKSKLHKMAIDWAKNDKTYIVLNGGNSETLQNHHNFLSNQNKYPTCTFREDEDSLRGIMTCVGILLPSSVWNVTHDKDSDTYVSQSDDEINKFGLKHFGLGNMYNLNTNRLEFDIIRTIKSAKLA